VSGVETGDRQGIYQDQHLQNCHTPMSALIKLPCILAVSLSLHVAHTTPSKAPANEHAAVDNILEKVVQVGIGFIEVMKVRSVLYQIRIRRLTSTRVYFGP
jgi:hypothetical protein